MNDDDPTRRTFLRAGASTFVVLSGSTGIDIDGLQVEEEDVSGDNVRAIADIIGKESERPEPGSEFLQNEDYSKEFFAYRFQATDSGAEYLITENDNSWRQLFTNLVEFDTDELPNEPASGTIFLDTTRRVIAWFDGNKYKWATHSPDLKTKITTVSGDEPETIVYEPDIANEVLDERRFHEMNLWGRYSTSTSSDFFTMRVKIAGTTVASIQSTSQKVTDAEFTLTTTIGVINVGELGTIEVFTSATFNNENKNVSHGRVDLDTTTTNQMAITVEWDAADPANSLEARFGKVQQDP